MAVIRQCSVWKEVKLSIRHHNQRRFLFEFWNASQKTIEKLLRKSKVTREQEGRAFRYRALVSKDRATGGALKDMVKRMFGGSPEALLMALVDSRQISADELNRIAQRLNDAGKAAKKEEK